MAKPTSEDWAKARAHYEAGKSSYQVEAETGINSRAIQRKIKSEGWEQGILSQLITNVATVKTEMSQLSATKRDIVDSEAKRLAVFMRKRDAIATAAFKRIERDLDSCEVNEIKGLVDAADKACVMVEIAPRFANATTINNTNASQTVNEAPKLSKDEWLSAHGISPA